MEIRQKVDVNELRKNVMIEVNFAWESVMLSDVIGNIADILLWDICEVYLQLVWHKIKMKFKRWKTKHCKWKNKRNVILATVMKLKNFFCTIWKSHKIAKSICSKLRKQIHYWKISSFSCENFLWFFYFISLSSKQSLIWLFLIYKLCHLSSFSFCWLLKCISVFRIQK